MQFPLVFVIAVALGFSVLVWLYVDVRRAHGRIAARWPLALLGGACSMCFWRFPTLETVAGIVLGAALCVFALWLKAQESSTSPSRAYRLLCRVI